MLYIVNIPVRSLKHILLESFLIVCFNVTIKIEINLASKKKKIEDSLCVNDISLSGQFLFLDNI